MIEAHATAPFTLDGRSLAEGEALSLPDNQFDDLAAVGLVARAAEPGDPPEPDLPDPGSKPARKGKNQGTDQ